MPPISTDPAVDLRGLVRRAALGACLAELLLAGVLAGVDRLDEDLDPLPDPSSAALASVSSSTSRVMRSTRAATSSGSTLSPKPAASVPSSSE